MGGSITITPPPCLQCRCSQWRRKHWRMQLLGEMRRERLLIWCREYAQKMMKVCGHILKVMHVIKRTAELVTQWPHSWEYLSILVIRNNCHWWAGYTSESHKQRWSLCMVCLSFRDSHYDDDLLYKFKGNTLRGMWERVLHSCC